VTPSAVIQVKRGIGDVIWHLPFIRAIAAGAPGGQITFLAPPSSHAEELLAAEPSVARTIYFEHAGSELQRGLNLVRLARLLRQSRFSALWILDRTIRPALAAMLGGVPERIGLGLGAQRRFITNPGIDQRYFHDGPVDWLRALMLAMQVPLPTTEPALRLPEATLAAIAQKFGHHARPWIALGIGASHPQKDWPDEYWAAFLAGLRTVGTVLVVGGPENVSRAQALIAQSANVTAVNACGLTLGESAALLRHADLFVGPNSAPLNLAAAGETEAFGLFGTTPVLTYSTFIHAIAPQGGISADGMRRIAPADVLERIAPFVARSLQ
jgi:lipopolysaccharide heptosyltransferase II